MISTGFVSSGRTDMHMKSKSSITTKKAQREEFLPLITPGELLNEEFLMPLGLTANALSLALRVPENRIQGIINGKRGITADTALRLGRYFGTTPEFWMNLQSAYELDKAKRERLTQIEFDVQRRPAA
jgi:addiction module HigA family antidote